MTVLVQVSLPLHRLDELLNILGTARTPAFSGDKVAAVLPLDAILATIAVGVAHIAAVVGPEGVVVAVVGASLGAGDIPLCKLDKSRARGSEGARDGRDGEKEDGREGMHFVCFQVITQCCCCRPQLMGNLSPPFIPYRLGFYIH